MDEWLNQYRAETSMIGKLDGISFSIALEAYRRDGDENGRRKVVGSCLQTVLETIESKWTEDAGIDLGDLIEMANHEVENTLPEFQGSNLMELKEFARGRTAMLIESILEK